MVQVGAKFFIPIDKETIRYNPKFSGPYVIPCKITYEQINSVKYVGDQIVDGIVVGDSEIVWFGPIRETKEYSEVYPSPHPEYLYEYEEKLVQCQNCWKTMWVSESLEGRFYDSFHNEEYYSALQRDCLWCREHLDMEYEKLDRKELERYAASNGNSSIRK